MEDKTIDINISFYENPGDKSTNIQFHSKDDELTVAEFVGYIKRAGLAYGFTEAQMSTITVA